MVKRSKIVVLGDILYDCFVWADRLPKEGETVTGYANGFYPGGKGANQAVQAAKLGAEVYLIGRVGNDDRGRFLIDELNKYGVNTEYIKLDESVATGTCCVHVADQGKNAIIVAPLANEAVTTSDVEQARNVIENADVFVAQLQLPIDAVIKGFEIAKAVKVTTIFDPAPLKEIDDRLFSMVDYITPNETETEFYTQLAINDLGMDEWCKRAARVFHSKGVSKVLLTMGSNGIYFSGAEKFLQPCVKVNAIDTTGAGDSFNGAFSVALAQNKEIKNAISFANRVAALTTTKRGSQPAMPTLSDINEHFIIG